MNNSHPPLETFISVDVETAGPNPSDYSLLTIGACAILDRPSTFYVEIKPVNTNFVPEALAVSRLSMDRLAERGLEPLDAMKRFATWLKDEIPVDQRPIFLAFNAPFDWMFVNDYFHRYLGHNPFGHAALDIKSYFMGLAGVTFAETSMRHVGPRYLGEQQLTHHSLRDAMDQADIFRKMQAEALQKRGPEVDATE
ncbi:MAG: 3'-5' exonuclease [Anaerolineales bacterium]|jgi:DNA polymerase III epsilon subunit-like protein